MSSKVHIFLFLDFALLDVNGSRTWGDERSRWAQTCAIARSENVACHEEDRCGAAGGGGYLTDTASWRRGGASQGREPSRARRRLGAVSAGMGVRVCVEECVYDIAACSQLFC